MKRTTRSPIACADDRWRKKGRSETEKKEEVEEVEKARPRRDVRVRQGSSPPSCQGRSESKPANQPSRFDSPPRKRALLGRSALRRRTSLVWRERATAAKRRTCCAVIHPDYEAGERPPPHDDAIQTLRTWPRAERALRASMARFSRLSARPRCTMPAEVDSTALGFWATKRKTPPDDVR